MKYLILLDRKFPYKSGEAFLENEIDEIANYFDKIYIFPSDVKQCDIKTRKIKSKNVEVFAVENKDYIIRRYEYVIKTFFSHKKSSYKNYKNNFEEKFFEIAVNSQFQKIKNKLETLKIGKNDYVYVYSYWLYINAGVAIKIAQYLREKNIKCKVVSRAHRFDIYEEERFLPAREYLLENLDNVFACSDNGSLYLKNKYSKYEDKILTSYLGTYDHGIGKKSEDGIFRIVSCSRISKIKRVDLIIKAIASIKDLKFKNIKWTHIGGGELADDVRKLANTKLGNKIKFEFLGHISNTDVYDYYMKNCVDLFINVSSSEGLPVSIMEAISFGIPVIATDVGGTSEIVINDVSGFLIQKNFKYGELSEKIMNIYNLPKKEYEELRIKTRNLWLEKYQAIKNYQNFANKIL